MLMMKAKTPVICMSFLLLLLSLLAMTTTVVVASSTTRTDIARPITTNSQTDRKLPSLNDPDSLTIASIGGGANRPTTPPSSPAPSIPSSEVEAEKDMNLTNVEDTGPLRRSILPFILSLSPIPTIPNYQQQIGIRDIVESCLEFAMMEKFSASPSNKKKKMKEIPNTSWARTDWSSSSPRSAKVINVGLTQVLNVTHHPTTTSTSLDGMMTVDMIMEGLVYFAEGSTEVPTPEELSLWIVQKALPPKEEELVTALTEYFSTVKTVATQLVNTTTTTGTTTTTSTSTEPNDDNNDTPTVAPASATPPPSTDEPTVATTESPTVMIMVSTTSDIPTEEVRMVETSSPTEMYLESLTSSPTLATTHAPTLSMSLTPTVDMTTSPTSSATMTPTVAFSTMTTTVPTTTTEFPTTGPETSWEQPIVVQPPTSSPVDLLMESAEPTQQPTTSSSSSGNILDDNNNEDSPTVTTSTLLPTVIVWQPTPSPTSSSQISTTTTTSASGIDTNPNGESNQDGTTTSRTNIKIGVWSGCVVAGFVVIILLAALLVKINKRRYYHYTNKSLLNENNNRHHQHMMGLAVLNFGTQTSHDDDSVDDVLLVPEHPIDGAKMSDVKDYEVLSGYIQEGDLRESESWASGSTNNNNHQSCTSKAKPGNNDVESGDSDGFPNNQLPGSSPLISADRPTQGADKTGDDVEGENCRSDTGETTSCPSQVAGNRQIREKEELDKMIAGNDEASSRAAAAASSKSFWSSLFSFQKPTKEDKEEDIVVGENSVEEEVDQLSCIPPYYGSSEVLSTTSGGAGTDGTSLLLSSSDVEDVLSIGPESVNISTSHESFEIRPLHDYIVKKDMLQSSATARGPMVGAAATTMTMKHHPHNSSKKKQDQEQNLASTIATQSNPSGLGLSQSTDEEDRLRTKKEMSNPYFRLPFNGLPFVDRSSSCVLKATDTSAATLAQRQCDDGDCYGNNNDDQDYQPGSHGSSLMIRMVPSMSTPGSWWRNTSPSPAGSSQKVDSKAYAGTAILETDDEATITSFVTSPCDGWDPADCEMGSKETSVPTEELFKLKVVDNKTGQCLIDDYKDARIDPNILQTMPPLAANVSEKQESTMKSSMKKKGNIGATVSEAATGGFEYTDYQLDGAESVSSEESVSLKLDSSYCF
jgi:hypothetical protein